MRGIWECFRFAFFDHMRLWYMKTHVFGAAAAMDNLITLSEQFWDEIREHPIEFSGTTASRPGRAHPACARRNLRRTTGTQV